MFMTIQAFKPQDVEFFLNQHLLSDQNNRTNYEIHLISQLEDYDSNYKKFFARGAVFDLKKFHDDTIADLQESRDWIIGNIGVDRYDRDMFDRIQKRHIKEAYDTTALKAEIEAANVIEVIKKSIKENYKNTYINWNDLNYEELYYKLTGYTSYGSDKTLMSKVLTERNYHLLSYDSSKYIDYEQSLRNLVILAITL